MADLPALISIFEVWGVPGLVMAWLWWSSRQPKDRRDPVAEILEKLDAMDRKQDETSERLARLEGWREGQRK